MYCKMTLTCVRKQLEKYWQICGKPYNQTIYKVESGVQGCHKSSPPSLKGQGEVMVPRTQKQKELLERAACQEL